jgi:hypothetical protein
MESVFLRLGQICLGMKAYIYLALRHSNAVFIEREDSIGDKTKLMERMAAKKKSPEEASIPLEAAITDPEPNMITGMYNGKTIIEINELFDFIPTVIAAPIDPIRLKIGVPTSKDITNTEISWAVI